MQCTSALAAVALARCDLPTAATRATETLAFADERGWSASPPSAQARLTQGWLAFHALDDGAAEELSHVAASGLDDELSQQLSVKLLESFARFGRSADRYAVVQDVREVWRTRWPGHVQPQLAAVASIVEQRMALEVGASGWASEVVDRAAELLGETGDVALLRALSQLHRGRPRAARQALSAVLDGEATSVSPLGTVESWLWEARLALRADEPARAGQAVSHAVALAAPLGLLRPFVHGGQEIAGLLARAVGTFGHDDAFVARARAGVRPDDGLAAESMLTARELELLGELPSMRTAEEIAASMFLSVNTVKTHIRGIYRKLGVTNRRDAVVLARRRGLL
jgi:LuxR family maltose regulon positive regulatory protein